MKTKILLTSIAALLFFGVPHAESRRIWIADEMTAGEKVETIMMLKEVIRDVQNMKCAVRLPFMRDTQKKS